MGALLGAALAIGACCGLPIAIGGVALILGKGKKRQNAGQNRQRSSSAIDACCHLPVSIARKTFRHFGGKQEQEDTTLSR